MHLIYNLLYLLAGWLWGDWRNWQKYYSTILFFILLDLFNNFLTYNHPLWQFNENVFPGLLPNHTTISLLVMFVSYPMTILIYLGHFYKTNSWIKRCFHYAFWVALYLAIEYLNIHLGLFDHHNGWEMGHSVLFVMAMFIIFPIHYKRPLIAWLITLGILMILFEKFEFPLEKMK